jgi:RNA polymerase sigma-32 factor
MSDKNTKLAKLNLPEADKYPPILSSEEEYELAVKLYENHDLEAAQKLVFIAYSFCGFYLLWL